MKLQGKVALITGSGQGIGKATALALAGEGAAIVVNDIVPERLQQASADLKAAGARVFAVGSDVTRHEQVSEMVTQAVETFGRIDILVNNVGAGRTTGDGVEIPAPEFKRLIDLNLKSQYLCCHAVVPHMQKQRQGKIVNLSSVAGKYRAGMADLAYTTAKAGVLGFTRFLACELGPYGIHVNCIVPGNVLTEAGEQKWKAWPERKREKRLQETPLRRQARPEDVAKAVLFLVSEDSSYITGVSLDVNGGWWMS